MIVYHPHHKLGKIDKEDSYVCDSSALKKQQVNYLLYKEDLKAYIPNTILNQDMELHYHYLISEFMECGWITYLAFIDICLRHNITHVVDIGCAIGLQSLLFNQFNITYHGIDMYYPFFNYYLYDCNSTSFSLQTYPFNTQELLYNHNHDKSAIISSLCMYWIINKSNEEQLYHMRRFKKAILHISNNVDISIFKKYYSIVDIYYKDLFSFIIYLER